MRARGLAILLALLPALALAQGASGGGVVVGGSGTPADIIKRDLVAGGHNVTVNPNYNDISDEVNTSLIAGGGAEGAPNRIGTEGAAHASVATISGGYDNINNQQAGTIAGGAHHRLEYNAGTGDHGFIGGGSNATIDATGPYNAIVGGTSNTISGAAGRGFIGGGSLHQLTCNACVIGGGFTNTVAAQFAALLGGNTNSISSNSDYGTIGGGNLNTISGITSTHAFIGGGTNNQIEDTVAVPTYSAIVGGSGNQAQSTAVFIGGGLTNTASGLRSGVLGGQNNTASGAESLVLGGSGNTAAGANSAALGGIGTTANGDYSTVRGFYAVTSATNDGWHCHASGRFTAAGDAQTCETTARIQTTSATPATLVSAGSQWELPDNTSWSFYIRVTARTAAGASAGYVIQGLIERNSGVATTAFVGGTPTPTVLGEDDAAWDVTPVASTSTGTLRVNVTGAAATTINWTATLQVTSVTL